MADINTILIPIKGPDLFESLLPPAIRAANKYEAKVILLHVWETFDSNPSSERIEDRQHMLDEAEEILEKAHCKTEILIKKKHKYIPVIKEVVQENDVNLILMGNHGNKTAIFNNEIPHRLQKMHCNILASRMRVECDFEKIAILADDLNVLPSMLEHATFLTSSDQSVFHIIFDFLEKNVNEDLDFIKAQVETFKQNNSHFKGEIKYTRLKALPGDHTQFFSSNDKKTCILIRYQGNWVEQLLTGRINNPDMIAQSTAYPTYLFKPASL